MRRSSPSESRNRVLDWAAQGLIPARHLAGALDLAGANPTARDSRRFIDAVFLWSGSVLCAAGVVFFFAFNWDALDRLWKFAIAEGALLVAVAAAWWLGLERAGGRGALLAAAILTGALLALYGQAYQTGADPYQLFAGWALLILPWVLISRLPAYWLLWLALLNAALVLYYPVSAGILGVFLDLGGVLWSLFALNLGALAGWEIIARQRPGWLSVRYAPRLIALPVWTSITLLAVWAVFDPDEISPVALLVYALWLGGSHVAYRVRNLDLFMLALAIASVICVTAAVLVRFLFDYSEAGASLLIAVVVIVLGGLGAAWLRRLASVDAT